MVMGSETVFKCSSRSARIVFKAKSGSSLCVSDWELHLLPKAGEGIILLEKKKDSLTGEIQGKRRLFSEWIQEQEGPVEIAPCLLQLHKVLENLQRCGLNPNKILLDPSSILLDPQRMLLEFLYLPVNGAGIYDPLVFAKDMVYRYGDVNNLANQQILNADSFLEVVKTCQTVIPFTTKSAPNQKLSCDEDATVLLTNRSTDANTDDEETFLLNDQPDSVSAEDETMLIPGKTYCLLDRDGNRYQLLKDRSVIGRSRNRADIVCTDPGISNIHASLICEEENLFLVDEGSKNGTYLHGNQLKPKERYRIVSGESFMVYTQTFTIEG